MPSAPALVAAPVKVSPSASMTMRLERAPTSSEGGTPSPKSPYSASMASSEMSSAVSFSLSSREIPLSVKCKTLSCAYAQRYEYQYIIPEGKLKA